MQPGQKVSVLYFDESEINPGGLVGGNGVTTLKPTFLVAGAVDSSVPVAIGTGFAKGASSGGFVGQDKFNHVLTATVPTTAAAGEVVGIIAFDGDQNKQGGDCGVISWTVATPPQTQHLSANILNCVNGVAGTTLAPLTGSIAETSGASPITTAAQIPSTSVAVGTYSLRATAPTGYDLVPCGATSGTNTATDKSATLSAGDTKVIDFYAQPKVAQTLAANIFSCVNGSPTATSVPGGLISVTNGATAINAAAQIPATPVTAGAYSLHADAPTGFDIVQCGSPTGTASDKSVTVGAGENKVVNFFVTPQVPGTPSLVVHKSGPLTGTAGGTGDYQITVTNNGSADATAVTFADDLPVGETFLSASGGGSCTTTGNPLVLSCSLTGPLAAHGGAATILVHVSFATDTAGQSLTDCAVLPTGASSCATTNIPGNPTLSVIKTNDANNDGNFTDTETAATPRASVTFQVVVSNTSDESITIDSVGDAYPGVSASECSNLLGTTLAAHHSVTCTFTITGYAPAAGSSLTDTVTVTGHDSSGTPTSAHDTSTVNTATPSTPGEPDLAILKIASLAKVEAGNTLAYSLLVSNVGQGATSGPVTVTDSVPTGLAITGVTGGSLWDCTVINQDVTCHWLGADIQPGAAAQTITITTTVLTTAPATLINTGVVKTPGDNNPVNDTSTVKTPVTTVLGTKIVKTPATPAVLPFTGSKATSLLPAGFAAVLVGLFLLVVPGRRRRRS